MDSWWELGEGSGISGEDLALYKVSCPFCSERGNFKMAFHAEKKKPNGSKQLNFDTLECGNCKGYVMILWSKSAYGGYHRFLQLPYPIRIESFPEYWPEAVGRYWLQAKRNISDGNWDAAAVMARSALQAALRDNNAVGETLKKEIQDLATKGILPPVMKDWSDNVRVLGNESAHPVPDKDAIKSDDAIDVVQFLDFLLEYLYSLPHKIKQYRKRAEEEKDSET